jgi:hypothetical protein
MEHVAHCAVNILAHDTLHFLAAASTAISFRRDAESFSIRAMADAKTLFDTLLKYTHRSQLRR